MTLEDNLLPKPLSEKELHQLAMNIAGEDLKKNNYEFLSVNSKLKKDPQFVCIKNKNLYFVIVRAVEYPNNPDKKDKILIDKLNEHAKKFKATLFYAGIGIANAENYDFPVFKNSNYAIKFNGFEKIC